MRIWTFFLMVLLLGCDSKDAFNCVQTNGDLIQEEFTVANFTSIRVRERIELVIKQGSEPSIIVETGANLLPDVSVIVEDGVLILRDANACNLFREYLNTVVYVTAPDINSIRNESGLTVRSDGVLAYPNLRLVSEDFTENDRINTDGDFNVDLAVENLELTTNNLSNYFIRGSADSAWIRIFAGDSRIEAEELIIQDLKIFHRGTNQVYVNPQLSVVGEIRSGGDVISLNRPPVVDVEEFYTGRLIFQD